jgi:Bacteriophage HK97-gp10, putative tail-component
VAELSREWLMSLDKYAQDFKKQANIGVQKATNHLHEEMQNRARSTPGWDQLADNIEVWSDDGQLIIGVRDNAVVSEAFALEYGDETRPPTPMFRTMRDAVDDAGEVYTEHLADAGVIARLPGVET